MESEDAVGVLTLIHRDPSQMYKPGVTSLSVAVLYTSMPEVKDRSGSVCVVDRSASRGSNNPLLTDSISSMASLFSERALSPTLNCADSERLKQLLRHNNKHSEAR